jgi:hypothetical protein
MPLSPRESLKTLAESNRYRSKEADLYRDAAFFRHIASAMRTPCSCSFV